MNVPNNIINSKNIICKDSSIFTKKHCINLISCLIVWFSGGMSILQQFENPLVKIIFYSLAFMLLIVIIERAEKFYNPILTKNGLFLILLIITAAAIFLYRLDYIGYPSIGGFTILWLIIIYYSQSLKVSLIQLAVFMLSPVIFLELISFSGIFSFSMLVVLSIFISERYLDSTKLDWKFFLIASLFGVTLSAEKIIGLVYIIYVFHTFRNDFVKMGIFTAAVFTVYFLLSFLTDKEYFTLLPSHSNYFHVQLPVWLWILLILVTLYAGWIVIDLEEALISSGVILFLFFLLSFILHMAEVGWILEHLNFNLLLLAIPFLVLSIKDYNVDRFLGKVYPG